MNRIILTIKILRTYMSLVHQFYLSENWKLNWKTLVTWRKKNMKKKKERLKGNTNGRAYFKHLIISRLKLASFTTFNMVMKIYQFFVFTQTILFHYICCNVLANRWKRFIEVISNGDYGQSGTTASPTLYVQGVSESDWDLKHCLK